MRPRRQNMPQAGAADVGCAVQGDLLLLAAGPALTVNKALDAVRQYLAQSLGEIDASKHALLWVTDFPLFEHNLDEQRYEVCPISGLTAGCSMRRTASICRRCSDTHLQACPAVSKLHTAITHSRQLTL